MQDNTNFLQYLTYNQEQRRYELLESSQAKLLTDMRIGTKTPGNSGYIWTLWPQEFVYLASCLDMPGQIVARAYSLMTTYEINKTHFYLWMRKRSRLVKAGSAQNYHIFSTGDNYNTNSVAYTVKVLQPETQLHEINWEGLRQECQKVAIVRNRDIVLFDVME